MSATTEPKHEAKHHHSGVQSGGWKYRKHVGALIIGGTIFALAWLSWTFWFSTLPS